MICCSAKVTSHPKSVSKQTAGIYKVHKGIEEHKMTTFEPIHRR